MANAIAAFTGWGSSTQSWGASTWNGGVATTTNATSAVGSVTGEINTDAAVTGLGVSGVVSTVDVVIIEGKGVTISLTGFSVTGSVGTVLVWGNLIPDINSTWTGVAPSIDSTWTETTVTP